VDFVLSLRGFVLKHQRSGVSGSKFLVGILAVEPTHKLTQKLITTQYIDIKKHIVSIYWIWRL